MKTRFYADGHPPPPCTVKKKILLQPKTYDCAVSSDILTAMLDFCIFVWMEAFLLWEYKKFSKRGMHHYFLSVPRDIRACGCTTFFSMAHSIQQSRTPGAKPPIFKRRSIYRLIPRLLYFSWNTGNSNVFALSHIHSTHNYAHIKTIRAVYILNGWDKQDTPYRRIWFNDVSSRNIAWIIITSFNCNRKRCIIWNWFEKRIPSQISWFNNIVVWILFEFEPC